MHTIVIHLSGASVLAVRHLANARRSAAGSGSAAQSLGSIGLVFLVILIAFFAMMARAARGMADLIAGFLRVAASMTSGLVVLVVVIITVALLAHP
jgi:succinate dehydrogenase/fumarate reductase cytochrome b subunit